MIPRATGPDGRHVAQGFEQLPQSSQKDQPHGQPSTHPIAPVRNPGPVRHEDWPDWPTATQKEIDELVEWVKGPR